MDNLLLRKLQGLKKNLRVGILGAGRFSTGMICQINRMTGIEISAISDVQNKFAYEALKNANYQAEQIRFTDQIQEAQQGIKDGYCMIVEDPFLMLEIDIDIVVDASGLPELGAEFSYKAIKAGKHVVMVNIEADCAIGPILRNYADAQGVVYTLADGDQPSLANGLYQWATTIGLDVTMIGKWSGTYSEQEAAKVIARNRELLRDSDFAHLDGTKNQMEMTCIANMTGFVPDIEGMHKPMVEFSDIPDVFRIKQEKGILTKEKVVDVINCRAEDGRVIDQHFRGGVFILVTSQDPFVLNQFNDKGLKMSSDGKRGIIYRQHHVIGVETPISILKACLLGEATGSPKPHLSADVISVAKKDLKAGEMLDGQGGETAKGVAVTAETSLEGGCLPISLAQGVKIRCDIAKGTKITYNMLQSTGDSIIWKLREAQDRRKFI